MRNTQREELAVCGLESVRALAAARPEAVRRLYFAEARAREFGPLCARLAAAKRPYNAVDAAQLERLSGTAHHQGVVAMIEDRPPQKVDAAAIAAWAASGARIVVLDRVGDDHNLGAIARSAAFFGWTAMVVGLDDGAARLTTSAYRVAKGALERIPVWADDSAEVFVRRCGDSILTIGADHRAAQGLRDAASARTDGRGLALILGNEETGLSPGVRAACARLVRIEGAGGVESLNVSQAAAIMLYELSPAAKPQGSQAARPTSSSRRPGPRSGQARPPGPPRAEPGTARQPQARPGPRRGPRRGPPSR